MGRRIVLKKIAAQTLNQASKDVVRTTGADMDQYLARLKNLVPVEVWAIYIAGQGFIPGGEKTGSLVLCNGKK